MQKETKKKIGIVATIVGVVLIFMLGYAFILRTQGHSDGNEKIPEKMKEEISYLDSNILAILNSLNNIIYEHYKIQTEQTSDSKTSSQTQSEQSEQGGQSGGSGQSGQGSQSGGSGQSGQSEQGGQSGGSGQGGQGSQSGGQDSGNTGGQSGGQQQGNQNQNVTQQSKMEEAGVLNTDRENIDWNSIKQQIEILYASWNTIALDLHAVNMNQDTILQFNTIMQQVIQAIKGEDKEKTMTSLASLYALLPQYSEGSGQDSTTNDLYKTKSEIIQAYGLLEQQGWEDMAKHVVAAQQNFMPQMNQVGQSAIRQANVNKIYMVLKEMETVCGLQDTEMFLMNYKEVMQQIQMLAHDSTQ